MTSILFLSAVLITAGSSVMVVVSRKPLSSALWLVLSLISTAAVFVFLEAHFLAAAQVILYAGSIMVLFIFVIMLVHHEEDPKARLWTRYRVPAQVTGAAVFGVLITGLIISDTGSSERPHDFGSVVDFSRSLISQNYWLFELTSVLLLVAIVGAVVISRFQKSGFISREVEKESKE